MNKLALDCIERVYIKKDYNYFKERSKQLPFYLSTLVDLINKMCKSVITYNTEDDPAVEIWIEFESFVENTLWIQYKTIIKISKIADIFVFQHEFSVNDIDPNRMTPTLDGFSEEPYVFSQYELEKAVSDFLHNKNLQKLQLAEMDEVIFNIEIPENNIFGNQMTLENALFRDLFEISES